MFCQDVPQLVRLQNLQKLFCAKLDPTTAKLDPTAAPSRPSEPLVGLPSATWPLNWPPNWLPSATWPPNSPPSATWTRFGRPTWLLNCQTAVQKLWQVAPSADVCILFLSTALPFSKNARPTKNIGKP